MNKKNTVTRAKAQKIIAGTTDRNVIGNFLRHENSHIKKYAAHKLAALEEAAKVDEKRAAKNKRDRERRAAKKAAAVAAAQSETEAA